MLLEARILELYGVHKCKCTSYCDASDYGVDCVLNHIVNGQEISITYASRTLNKSKRNDAQLISITFKNFWCYQIPSVFSK